eukprot:TRINITY_DN1288_c0_g2_i1.p1 TRINITY_DN1288_c0_g2~~TRINITY_DN1288_c0_g2_i1.p1  ORF type:complete len:117 (-),score=1.55 TRINITY_DN1288_c0_g2_i1:207-557(-)
MASTSVVACVLLACIILSGSHAEAAISCGQVVSAVSPCMTYLRSGGPIPPACCNGVKALNSAAKTTPDRQQTCSCLKSIAARVSGINLGLAAGLPSKCGVSVSYKISPSTDCTKVK